MTIRIFRGIICAAIVALPAAANAHDIYSGIRNPKTNALCCGGTDCSATVYRERGDHYEFLTREQRWVEIPEGRIIFLPIPGDAPDGDDHRAHLCYRVATPSDSSNVFDGIYLYCAFIPPGAI